jgi:hypothetical protein
MQPKGFIISVFANGVAQIPANASPKATLFYVEISMIAEINTVEGYFTVQAALAPASHVLVPSCRLTGGFALVNWFVPSPHSGDFVFTVGGYHRAYSPPLWYPKVDRIDVLFTVGDMINVSGGVYFAITPKCVMGGGFLHMGLDVGPVSAWLDISLDVFIQFKAFTLRGGHERFSRLCHIHQNLVRPCADQRKRGCSTAYRRSRSIRRIRKCPLLPILVHNSFRWQP